MASSGMLLVLLGLLSLFAFAQSRNVGEESTTVLEYHPTSTKLGDTYCCRKNGFGTCQQECDSGLQYYCCLKNGYGCQQLCESGPQYECCLKNGYGCTYMCKTGIEHYCCEKNGYGCTKMCPKTANLNIALPNA